MLLVFGKFVHIDKLLGEDFGVLFVSFGLLYHLVCLQLMLPEFELNIR